jgi:hypothetical protein
MPVHDWTRVDAGIFHDFHTVWIGAIRSAMNEGLLPEGYYALAEQHAGRAIADVLTLHTAPTPEQPPETGGRPPTTGGIAVAEAVPRVRRKQTLRTGALMRSRTLAIRHVSGHRLVAMLEIVSPANKDRARHVETFAAKVVSALEAGIHLLLVDLFPPGPHDPWGMHGVILDQLEQLDAPYDLPSDEPMTLASYASGLQVDVYLEHSAVGAVLPDMPLFLRSERYISVPLESTYAAAYRGMPTFWKAALESKESP